MYGWLIRVEQYFRLNYIAKEERVDAVIVTLEDQALNWFHWWED